MAEEANGGAPEAQAEAQSIAMKMVNQYFRWQPVPDASIRSGTTA